MNGQFSYRKHSTRIVRLARLVVLVALVCVPFGQVSAQEDMFTILDTLGIATPSDQFPGPGSSGAPIYDEQLLGPEFTLTVPTVVTEIGAFINNCAFVISGVPQCTNNDPIMVQIRPSLNGKPHPSTILASYAMTDDHNPLVASFESAQMELQLEPGTYFAIFAKEGDIYENAGLLMHAPLPFPYTPEIARLGYIMYQSDDVRLIEHPAAVRILGQPVVQQIGIDIRPGAWPNRINPKSKGVIPVAILSSADFDAIADVDPDSLTFGHTGDEPSLVSCLKAHKDVNKDGRLDRVCHFSTERANFHSGDKTGTLKGQMVSGSLLIGRDFVQIVK